jgi:tetratricopeptide (TPR) repeat protein
MSAESSTSQQPLRAARAALKRKQAGPAVRHLDSLLARERDHAEAWELLGIAHTMAGDVPAARRAFEEATRRAPQRASAHYNFALFLAGINELDEAVLENQAALYLAPTHSGALSLQRTLAERIRFREHTADVGFAAVGKGAGPSRDPEAAWNHLECPICGARNFVTVRVCARCGNLLPEAEEIVPVE